MLSFRLRSALERAVIGQHRAVQTILRTVTVALGGLGNRETPLGVYLLVGPSGTGKTHLACSLARLLHGSTRRLMVVDCIQLTERDGWPAIARQISPHFRFPTAGQDSVLSMAPLSILLVEHLEAARPQVVQALVNSLETGLWMLPEGKCGTLRGSIVLMTSKLCSREIFEAGRQEMGFSPATPDLEETEKARIYQLCVNAAEKQWGSDFLAHLDDLVVFHRLRASSLPAILDRLLLELNQQLSARQVTCHLDPAAVQFLSERSSHYLRHGAWMLGKLFRRFVVFPVADLLSSGRVRAGSRVLVELDEAERLRFQVEPPAEHAEAERAEVGAAVRVPVEWDETLV